MKLSDILILIGVSLLVYFGYRHWKEKQKNKQLEESNTKLLEENNELKRKEKFWNKSVRRTGEFLGGFTRKLLGEQLADFLF